MHQVLSNRWDFASLYCHFRRSFVLGTHIIRFDVHLFERSCFLLGTNISLVCLYGRSCFICIGHSLVICSIIEIQVFAEKNLRKNHVFNFKKM
jgi:hypothetical protein